MGKVAEMAEEKVEAPERVWLHYPESMNRTSCCERDVEYVRVDHVPNTRQRAERAAAKWFEKMQAQSQAVLGAELLADIIAAEFEK